VPSGLLVSKRCCGYTVVFFIVFEHVLIEVFLLCFVSRTRLVVPTIIFTFFHLVFHCERFQNIPEKSAYFTTFEDKLYISRISRISERVGGLVTPLPKTSPSLPLLATRIQKICCLKNG